MNEGVEIQSRVVCIGKKGSGKTSLLAGFTTGAFLANPPPTSAITESFPLQSTRYWEIGITDPNNPNYRHTVSYYSQVPVVLICVDLSADNQDSDAEITSYIQTEMERIKSWSPDCQVVVVGTKGDDPTSAVIQSNEARVKKIAENQGCNFVRTSAEKKEFSALKDILDTILPKTSPTPPGSEASQPNADMFQFEKAVLNVFIVTAVIVTVILLFHVNVLLGAVATGLALGIFIAMGKAEKEDRQATKAESSDSVNADENNWGQNPPNP